jgi:hypothetical protein
MSNINVIYEYEKYVCTSSTLWETLQRYGVAIIPSVLSSNECKAMVDGMWNTLEHITQDFDVETTHGPIDRNNENTWRSFYELFPQHSMLVQHHGVGHAQHIWDIRQNPKILKIWTDFWELDSPEELLVSFDALSYHFPPEKTGKGWYAPKNDFGGWLHSDQSFTRNDFECVQSWVTGLDVNNCDASLVVLEGSHKYHGLFAKKFNMTDTSDWGKLNESAHYDFFIKGGKKGNAPRECPRRVIKCPKGSMVFWDSRTIHAGQEPVKTRKIPNFRSVVYLCYAPRYMATETALKKKTKYFEEQRMTSHWPHKIKVFAKKPYTRGAPMPEMVPLPKPILKPIGRYLAGYSNEDDVGRENEMIDENSHVAVGDIPPYYELDEDGYVKIVFID